MGEHLSQYGSTFIPIRACGAGFPDRSDWHGIESCMAGDHFVDLGAAGCDCAGCDGGTLCFRYRCWRALWNCGGTNWPANLRTNSDVVLESNQHPALVNAMCFVRGLAPNRTRFNITLPSSQSPIVLR